MTSNQPQARRGATGRKVKVSMGALIKCAEDHLTASQTAKKLKVNEQVVRRACKKHSIQLKKGVRGRKPTKKDGVRTILLPFMNEALASVDYEAVAKAMKVSKVYVYKVAKEMKAGLLK
jgi:hypothetical protein